MQALKSEQPLKWEYRHTVLGLCMLAFFVTMATRVAISPLVPFITSDFAISDTLMGLTMSALWVAYALAQFPSGVLADKFSERPVILVAIGGTALATFVLSLAPNFLTFLLFAAVLGLVAGLHYSVATTLISRSYDNIGFAIGIHNVGAPLAGLLIPGLVAWIGMHFGWRVALGTVAIVGAPITFGFWYWVRPVRPRRPDLRWKREFHLTPLLKLLRRKSIVVTLCIAIMGAFIGQAVLSFYPVFLIAHQGQSATEAGVVFSAYFVLKGLVQVGVGGFSDEYGRDPAIVGCMLSGGVGFWLIVSGTGLPVLVLGVMLTALGTSYQPAINSRFLDRFYEDELGTDFGLVRTVYGVLGASGPVMAGMIADRYDWGTTFQSIAFLMFATALLVLAVHAVSGR